MARTIAGKRKKESQKKAKRQLTRMNKEKKGGEGD
jgi:hypothetical protein